MANNYDYYVKRKRYPVGVKIKKSQAIKFVNLACMNRKNQSILEIGPGDGYIAELSKEHNFDYIGLESNKHISKNLEKLGYNVVNCFVPPIPKMDNNDVCFMMHVIEHLDSLDSASILLSEIYGNLSSGGKLVIASPDYSKWKQDFYKCDGTHKLPFTNTSLKELLVGSNFKIIYENTYVGPLFGLKSMPLFFAAKIFYSKVLDNFMKKLFHTEVLYKAYLTFLPNLIIVAEKND